MASFALSFSSSKESFKTHFIGWVVEQNMPLTIGDSPAFISMIKVANKRLTIPNYRKIYHLLYWKKTQAMCKLKCFLEKKYFSIKCDHCTSIAQENYGALTLHLLDKC
jgi:hypothetical protein